MRIFMQIRILGEIKPKWKFVFAITLLLQQVDRYGLF